MRRVRLWVDTPLHEPYLVLEQIVPDDARVDFPGNLFLAPHERFRWESEQIAFNLVSEDEDIAPVPAEPDTVPQWFLDWRMSQYRADVCELADNAAGQKATIHRLAEVVRTNNDEAHRIFRVRKSVKEARRERDRD